MPARSASSWLSRWAANVARYANLECVKLILPWSTAAQRFCTAELKSAVIVLASVEGGKVQLAAGVTADHIGKVKAGELVNFVAQQVGGKGGGKPDMAMAGGTNAAALPAALASVQAWVTERL